MIGKYSRVQTVRHPRLNPYRPPVFVKRRGNVENMQEQCDVDEKTSVRVVSSWTYPSSIPKDEGGWVAYRRVKFPIGRQKALWAEDVWIFVYHGVVHACPEQG